MRIYPKGTKIKYNNDIGSIIEYRKDLGKWEIDWISRPGWVGWLKDSEFELLNPIKKPKIEIKPLIELNIRRR